MAAEGGCADAKLKENLTVEEFATAMSMVRQTPEDQATTKAEFMSGDYARLIKETPPGGQGQYARVACDWYVSHISPNPSLGFLVYAGYSGCGVNMYAIDAGRQPPSLDAGHPTDEVATKAGEAAVTYLCPQYAGIVTSVVDDPVESLDDCSLTLGTDEGTIEVTEGTQDCKEASKIITSGYEKILDDGGKTTVLETNDVTEWLCSYANTTSSVLPDYDLKCETPMGDKQIEWTAN
ncbi:hypothetical protein EEB13_12845 [Rhodococcus sp. WS3]|uniref:hypothetical protein n=1 Tax=Rhodococcus sp. WS3 TaxID=2486271 RepID=UPI0011419457|nr:hypothetical protein [Rhodococcus sp. WS3]ROZ50630.1 hypothetical protein EEB13_12845 [Rhodococcus sp. WS3]